MERNLLSSSSKPKLDKESANNNIQKPKPHNRILDHLLLLDGLENLDNATLVVRGMNSLENLTVFPTPHLPHHLVFVLLSANNPKNPKTKQRQPTNQKKKKKNRWRRPPAFKDLRFVEEKGRTPIGQ